MSAYEIREADDGSWYYVVVSEGNHQVLSTSETYPTKQHVERAVEDAKANE